MASYKDITARINALKARAEVVRQREAARVIKQARATIAAYGLTAEDFGLTQSEKSHGFGPPTKAPRKTPRPTSPSGRPYSQVKYRDDQGNAWSGRGPRPAWLKAAIASGKALDDLEVKADDGQPRSARTAVKPVAKRAVQVKWKDDAGHTWSGRGTKPAWFKAVLEAGKTLDELAA